MTKASATASVIQDANGYRLALVSNSSGAPGDIKMSNNTTALRSGRQPSHRR
jgi:hypothetical protein